MPNLGPPVTTVEAATAYKARIMDNLPASMRFEPLMTLYLTEVMPVEEIVKAAQSDVVAACKLYPAGATTNSASGVKDPKNIWPLFAAMEEHDLPLLLHGEVTDHEIDIFDREAVFIERHLGPIREAFPKLRIVLEHITTANSVEWVKAQASNTAATITPQHLILNRNDMLVGGIRPHNYCLPVLKRRTHQEALQQAAISGDPRFFLGTDSAPHSQGKKENSCGCAGCYSAHSALTLYAMLFDALGALGKLEGFASCFGPDFYKRPRNSETVTLVEEPYTIAKEVVAAGETFIPWMAGETIPWSVR
jgi:dihydroorotase